MKSNLSILMILALMLSPLFAFSQNEVSTDVLFQKKRIQQKVTPKNNTPETKKQLEGGCLNAPEGQYPETTYIPFCSGSDESITNSGWTGEYSKVKLTAGITYTFSSYEGIFITIGDEAGVNVLATGTTSAVYTPTTNEVVRFYIHTDPNCGVNNTFYPRLVKCGSIPVEPEYGCQQNYDGQFSASVSTNNVFAAYVASDFFVPKNAQTFKLNSVTLLLLPMAETPDDINTFTIQILSDSGSDTPGNTILKSYYDIHATSVELDPRTYLDYELYKVKLDLEQFELPVDPNKDTRYWISVTSNTFSGQNSLYWIEYTHPDGWRTAPTYKKNMTTGDSWTVDTHFNNTYETVWSLDASCGAFATSDINLKNVNIHPNPVKDFLTFESKSPIKSVSVYNTILR